ncbi:DNA polymerase domain-containing protein [Marinitoga litoralis]|uniref:DNA polymerase domain-containing protein n=1 Tax=Marinitoga litoralis TaxID=570855 RepID=UPI00195F2975|nr:DNA polymerase domain-containing protein [Marinitoga litoralis]MBM7558845.1 DNA polymerase-2 [Marinitoga litoralis]
MVTSIWQDPNSKEFYFREGINTPLKKEKKYFNLIFEDKEIIKVEKILLKNRIKNYIDVDFEWKDIYGKRLINTTLDIPYYKLKKIIEDMEKNNINIYGKNIMNIFNKNISENPDDKKIWFLDIEVDSDNIDDYSGNITSITFYDSFKKEYIALVVYNEKIISDSNIITFNSEKELLKYFSELIKKEQPDIITGWFSNGFDIPYIIERANKHKINISAIPNLKHNSFQIDGRYYNSIPGVNLIDYLELYRRYVLDKPSSYKLDIIAKHHNIEGKTEIKGYNYYNVDIKKFIDYIFRDVEILVELEKQLKLIGLICSLQALIRIPFNLLFGTSNSIEHYIQQFIMKDKITFRYYERPKTGLEITGAIVLTPPNKTYDNVIVLDFTSLYPNIITTFNISTETLVYDPNYNGKHIDLGKIMPEEENDEYLPLKFTLKKKGIIASLVKHLLKERLYFKKLAKETPADNPNHIIYDIKQYNYKILLNSIYGVLGTKNFALHDIRVSLAVLAAARSALRFVNNTLDNHYFENIKINNRTISFKTHVLYSDTDSSFNYIECEETLSHQDMIEIGNYIANYINEILPKKFVTKFTDEKIDCTLNMEVDKIYKRVRFFGVKKRYFGYDFNRKIITHGVEIIRRDIPEAIKEILTRLFLKALDKELSVDDIVNEYINLKNNSIEEIALIKSIRRKNFSNYKTLPNHIKSAIFMERIYNFKFNYDDRLLYYYIKYYNYKYYNRIKNIFNKNPENGLYYISASIEREHIEDFKKLLYNDFEIDYYTLFEKQVLASLKQFSEYRNLIDKANLKIKLIEGYPLKAEQLKLFEEE